MFLDFVWSQSYMITGSATKIYCLNLYLFEQIKVFICEDQIWLDVLKICYTTSKLQWSNPKHTFCLWKLGEDIHQSIIEFLVFLVKDFDSRRSLTISAQSLLGALALLSFTGASQIAFGNAGDEVATAGVEEALLPLPQLPLPPTTTATASSSAKLAPGPARHELTHLRVTHPWWPCKTMELPCFFSMGVAIVLAW